MTTLPGDLTLRRIDGTEARLADWRGKVLLVVNVASKCGLTPQYEGLQALYAARRAEGLEVLGFPCNDFRGQEPGDEAEIATFCDTTYGVEFPLFGKLHVGGPDRHPLYAALTAAVPHAEGRAVMRDRLAGYGIETAPEPEVLWNFEKFVVGRDGAVLARFSPDVAADDPRLAAAIDRALAA